MNINKINLIFAFFLLFGIFQGSFVFAEDELIDICAIETSPIGCGEGLSIFGSGFEISEEGIFSFIGDNGKLVFNQGEENEIVLEGNEGVEISALGEINFVNEGGEVIINGNKFGNIQAKSEDKNAFIKMDSLTGKISEAEFWTNENPGIFDFNEVNFESPENSLVKYNRGILQLEENSKINYVSNEIEINGNEITLPSEDILNYGNLNFDSDGNAFVSAGEVAEINKIQISSDENVEIFFDGLDHEGNYICFGEDTIKLETLLKTISLNFEEGNSYMEIEEGDYVQILCKSNSEAILTNRDSDDLIPKFDVFEGNFDVDEDGKTIKIVGDRVYLSGTNKNEDSTTSPLEIVVEGNSEKVFVDNFNRLASVPLDVEEYFADSEGIDVKFSSRVSYNYVDEEDLGELIDVEIEFSEEVSEGSEQLTLGRLRDYYDTLTDESKEALNSINVLDIEELRVICKREGAKACATDEGLIYFGNTESYFDLDTFKHETAHTRQFALEYEFLTEAHQSEESKGLLDDLENLYALKEDLPQEEYNSQRELIGGRLKEIREYNPFEEAWNSISIPAPEDYTIYSVESLYGYVRGYGAENQMEDVATFVGEITKLNYFKYYLSDENEWSEIYQGKLDLLKEYKFISEDEYNAIMEAAGK